MARSSSSQSDRSIFVLVAASTIFTMSACSTGGQKLIRSGFISDYSRMQKLPEYKSDLVYVATGYAPASYSKIIIEPVEWRAPARPDKAQDKLKADFETRLSRSLSKRYGIDDAAAAGPGVMRVRSAANGTRPARWYYNVPVQAAQLALGSFGLFRPSSGGASEELEVQDSLSGQPLVRISTFRNGKPRNVTGSCVPTITHATHLRRRPTCRPR